MWTFAPGAARADNATEANFHFKRGMQLVAKARYEPALAAFFQSNRLSPNPSVVFNIARCLELLGHYDEAFSYLSEFSDMAKTPEDQADARAALDRVLPQVARLNVRTRPEGAALYLDRKNLGQVGLSPRLLAAPEGTHDVIVELAGHRSVRREVVLVKGAVAELQLELVRVLGRVEITSSPPGAVVRIGGKDAESAGVTPAELSLPPGAHEVWLSLEGYRSLSGRAIVIADRRSTFELRLAALPPATGRVTVMANFPGSLVALDGKAAGFTPAVLDEIEAGEHEVVVSRDGYLSWGGRVQIVADNPLWVSAHLEPERQPVGRGPWPWVFLATAATAAAGGGLFAGLAAANHGDFEGDPSVELMQRGERLNLVADAMFASAAVFGAASAALFLLGEKRVQQDSAAQMTGGSFPPMPQLEP